jgi:hypothetical protein
VNEPLHAPYQRDNRAKWIITADMCVLMGLGASFWRDVLYWDHRAHRARVTLATWYVDDVEQILDELTPNRVAFEHSKE